MSEKKQQSNEKGDNFSPDLSLAQPLTRELAPLWLSSLIESADDAIISKTLEGVITSWNKAAENIFGYRAEEIVGKSILTLIPPALHGEEQQIIEKLKRGERIKHYETTRVGKGGRLIEISLTVSPIKTDEGKIIGASKVVRDITREKQIEQARRESENQLRLVADALPVLIAYVDREHRYRFVNRGYSDWFGVSLPDVIGKHIREIIGEAAYAIVLPKIERVMAGEKFDFEQRMPYPGGERIIHVDYIPSLDEKTSQVKGFFALVRDVTEDKKAEARLRESEERLRLATEAARMFVWENDYQTGKIKWSENAPKIIGTAEGEKCRS